MQNSKVSIITPSFNRGYIISDTAKSIFNQTYKNWEWIVVDDGSTDNSWQILEDYARLDERVKIYRRHREPKGASTCRNIGVEKASGEYLVFLDTDDLLATFCLAQRISAVTKDPQSECIIFPMLLFKEQPDDLSLLWNIDKNIDEVSRLLMGDAICQGTGTIWRKDAFVRIGMWKEDLKLWQDVELHLRAYMSDVIFTKRMDLEPDTFIRISEISLSRTDFHSLPKIQSRLNVFSEILQKICSRGLLNKYIKGLRVMALGILKSLIKNRQFALAKGLINELAKNSIFPPVQIWAFKRIVIAYKLRLDKVFNLENYFENLNKGGELNSSIGQYKYPKKIMF